MDVSHLIKVLSSEVNLQILSILRSGSFNPRELSRILGRDETDISRRLRSMERLGLVEGKWVRLSGKNVKVYSLKVEDIRIRFEPGEVLVSTSGGSTYSVPFMESKLPEVEPFFGRENEIELITSSKKRVVVIYGIAGIGKTTLAAKIFGNAFWYQMTEEDSFEYFVWQVGLFLNTLGYDALLEYLRAGGREERDIFELVLDGIEKSSAKIVIDDLHKCRDERTFRLLGFLSERIRRGRLVITSREKPNLGFENVLYVHLTGLTPEDSYSLIRAKGIEMSPEEFAKIYHITLGHPLALTLFSEAYAGRKEFNRESFFDFILEEIYGKLREKERLLLQIMSLFDEPLEYDEIKALYGKNVFSVLHSLLNKGLVERRGDVYSTHDLIRGFLKEVREIDERQAYMRHLEYLLKKNTARNFLRAFRYAVRIKDNEWIKRLVEARVRRFKRIIQDFPDAYMKLLVEIKENPYALKELAHVYFQKGFFEKALGLWLEVKDELEGIHRADVLSSLVDVYIELNRFEEAGKYLEELETFSAELKDPEVEFWYYVELTKFKAYKEDAEGALTSAFKEIELVKKLRIPEQESLVLLHIGDIYTSMEWFEEGIKYYLQALKLARAYSLSFMEHLSEMELTKAYYNLGDYSSSINYGISAVEYFLKVRNYRRAVDALAYRCLAYMGLGDLGKAKKDAEEMIKIAQSTGYPLGWAGYVFLAELKYLRGENWREYMKMGQEKLRNYPWLYDAVLDELRKTLDTSPIQKEPEQS